MKLYKKLFSYMPERKIHGILAAILAAVGEYATVLCLLFNLDLA